MSTANIDNGAIRNGKIPPERVRLPSGPGDGDRLTRTTASRPSNSLKSDLATRVRELAHRERTTQSAIIDCALWFFFDKGQDANVSRLMRHAGIAQGRRRV